MPELSEPSIVAYDTVVAVMLDHESKGEAWKKQSVQEHIDHAIAHLSCVDVENEDHLKQALTRIAFALTLEEQT